VYDIHHILKTYWGYDQFRPLQEDIVRRILEGKDTLALLPTGGGKSICFQVPALAMDGICIVVSPLIALMQDQVQNLVRRGIKAVAITGGMSKKEIDVAFDNCVYGQIKFLYLSPERLQTELARVRIARMKVNFFAVDEAHCISQWGYDFRPPYLQIAEIRELHPNAPVLALTATATPQVAQDIMQRLAFKNGQVIQSSFRRDNLAYVVRETDDKLGQLLKVAKAVKGSGVVYVRNRRKTGEIALFLHQQGIPSTFYHAGLPATERASRQQLWLDNTAQVMVATNAFGMGIDKPDVRFVAHMDLPDSPEAYFQEAGRGGRDGKDAGAILFWHKRDLDELQKQLEQSFPPVDEIRKVYQAIGNLYQIPVGSGFGQTVVFDMKHLCDTYKLDPILVFHAMKTLEREGYITFTDAVYQPSRVMITVGKEELYRYEVAHPEHEQFIKLILRMYGGMFEGFVRIKESEIAPRLNTNELKVAAIFNDLMKKDLLHYQPQTDRPLLTFTAPRADAKSLYIAPENLALLRKTAQSRVDAMTQFVQDTTTCRQQKLLAYFGEQDAPTCGKCDVCKKQTETERKLIRVQLRDDLLNIITQQQLTLNDFKTHFPSVEEKELSFVLRQLLDQGIIKFNQKRQIILAKNG
jgi:ATP-dependent DNA helicase RecQ